jgi:hypothetical protein
MNAPEYFQPFDRTDDTFENRVGKPEALYAALRIITMDFSELEYLAGRIGVQAAFSAPLILDDMTTKPRMGA